MTHWTKGAAGQMRSDVKGSAGEQAADEFLLFSLQPIKSRDSIISTGL